jgi:hypothetical protein
VHSRRTLPMNRSALQLALNVRGGILTASTLSAANTLSKAAVNFVSRSRMRNRNDAVRSPRSRPGFVPAGWSTHRLGSR